MKMTQEQLRNSLRASGFEIFVDPEATERILNDGVSRIVEKLQGMGRHVGTKPLSGGEHLILVEGLYHGEKDNAFVVRTNDYLTYSWKRIPL